MNLLRGVLDGMDFLVVVYLCHISDFCVTTVFLKIQESVEVCMVLS
jgi:hypothetical protein